jgi:hypothetical protein
MIGLGPHYRTDAGKFALLGTVALFFFTHRHARAFCCPHCRKPFRVKGWRSRRCATCGIRFGTPKSAVVAAAKSTGTSAA